MHWISILLIVLAPIVILLILLGRLAHRPAVYPYALVVTSQIYAVIGLCLRRVGFGRVFPPEEFFKSLMRHSVENYRNVAAAAQELDLLPTVKKGNQALGLKSSLEAQVKRVSAIPSPYTNNLQRPYFFIPGVPSKTFYDNDDFEWIRPLESSFGIVKEELLSLLKSESKEFKQYKTEFANLLEGWNTFNFFIHGQRVEENCKRCPKTVALLESLPRFEKQHIMFSALNPHAHLPAHYGPMNGILRAHLPLIVPKGCRIRVGNDVRTWEEGKVLVFDDSYNHEVWNDSDQTRIVLFVNFWHPCFSEKEIEVLDRLRRTLEFESPTAQDWKKFQLEPRATTLEM
jgi:aspartyl/asparaginyl beta-hydroxylase (cupin superfamily)